MDKSIYALLCVIVVLGLPLWLVRRYLIAPRKQKIKDDLESVRSNSSESDEPHISESRIPSRADGKRVADELRAMTGNQQSDNTIGEYTPNVKRPHGARSLSDIPANQTGSMDCDSARKDGGLNPSKDSLLATDQSDRRESPNDLSATIKDNDASPHEVTNAKVQRYIDENVLNPCSPEDVMHERKEDIDKNAKQDVEVREGKQRQIVGESTSQVYSKDEQIFRRVFLDKANKCSEREVVDLCAALNGRIDSLVLNVQDKWDKVQDEARERTAPSIALGVSPSVALGSDVLPSNTDITELVKTALGSEIHKAVTSLTTEDPNFDAVVQDALQAWVTFCVYSAIKPLLFGLQQRTQKDVEEAVYEIEKHEPEIAKVWNKLREKNTPATKCRTPADSDSYRLLEETYHQMLFDGESPAIALHWRALLHTYDRTLDSFNVAFRQTQEVLCEGLFEVFVLAGGNPPDSFLDSIRVLTAKKRIIEEASRVAENVVTGCFWVNLEVFVVDPGSLYDSESMVLDGQEHTTEAVAIKCTIGLGLREIVPRAASFEAEKETKRVLLKARVLSSI